MSQNNTNKRKQLYRTAWESLPDFKGWLQKFPGDSSRAFCTVCRKSLLAHRLTLMQHSCTAKHTKLAQTKFLEDGRHTQSEMSENLNIKFVEYQPKDMEYEKSDAVTSNAETPTSVINVERHKESEVSKNLNIEFSEYQPRDMEYEKSDAITSNAETPPSVSNVLADLQAGVSNASVQKANYSYPISTHVLDVARGLPVSNLPVSLYKLIDGKWTSISESFTNPDGRCNEFILSQDLKPGRFKIHFDVDRYFELCKQRSIYPFIEVVFDIHSSSDHLHIPLIISPFGYSTYKGS